MQRRNQSLSVELLIIYCITKRYCFQGEEENNIRIITTIRASTGWYCKGVEVTKTKRGRRAECILSYNVWFATILHSANQFQHLKARHHKQ
jgi:hypothetical protein